MASKPTSMFINLETGQPAFACVAIDWNVALSMPGVLAMTVRVRLESHPERASLRASSMAEAA